MKSSDELKMGMDMARCRLNDMITPNIRITIDLKHQTLTHRYIWGQNNCLETNYSLAANFTGFPPPYVTRSSMTISDDLRCWL
jgi:hypothetical protein